MFERFRNLFAATAQAEVHRGLEAEGRGERAAALKHFEKATQADPSWSVPWFNLGLLYKEERRWADSLRCSQRAAELRPEDGGAWWNLGIPATALGQWDEARRAWRACGMTVSEAGHLEGFPPPRARAHRPTEHRRGRLVPAHGPGASGHHERAPARVRQALR
jgi:hypothetical protein